LICGRHRVAAYKELEQDKIPAVVLDTSPATAQFVGLIDNLHRNEPSVLDKAVILVEMAVWLQKHRGTLSLGLGP
jgi:ParB-like chromosome segregation protein Spo0J